MIFVSGAQLRKYKFVSGAQLRAGAMEGAAESGTGWVSFSDQDTKITLLMFMKYNLPDTYLLSQLSFYHLFAERLRWSGCVHHWAFCLRLTKEYETIVTVLVCSHILMIYIYD